MVGGILAVGVAVQGMAETPTYRQVAAEEVRVRDGIGNVMKKIKAGGM
jgi:hypothetical protein